MAIAFDNYAATGAVTDNTSNITYSYNAGSGANRFLVVVVSTSLTSDTVSGVTYNGVAMTNVAGMQRTSVAGDYNVYTFCLIGPATGSNTVTVTWTTPRSSAYSSGFNATYTGVSQTGQPTGGTTASGTATTGSVSVTTTDDNSWLIGEAQNNANFITAGANTTQRSAASSSGYFDTNSAQTPAGSKTMNVAFTGSTAAWKFSAAAIAPVGAAGPANVKSWDGLATASVKTINGLAIASVKTVDGLN